METSSVRGSPPLSPPKRFSFSVDSLLSTSTEERPVSKASVSDGHPDNQMDHASDISNRSTPESDTSNEQRLSESETVPTVAAALRQSNFLRQAAPQIHSALLYPWLMTANLMNNPATILANANTQQQSG